MKPCAINTPQSLFFSLIVLILLTAWFPARAQDSNVPDSLSRAFYDSLKVKAEKRRLTSLLYDMVIVTPAPPGLAMEKMTSTSNFDAYSGRVIRNTEIVRLDAFGYNIENPREKPRHAGRSCSTPLIPKRKGLF